MLKLIFVFAAVLPLGLIIEKTGTVPFPNACGIAFLVIAITAAAILAAWTIRYRKRVLRALRVLADGRSLGESGSDETAHLLGKVAERQAALEHDASDAQTELRAILAGMDDGVLVADHRHTITLANPALLQIFALKGDVVGQTVLTALRLPMLQTMLDGVRQDGIPQQAEIDVPGGKCFLVISATPLHDVTGKIGALVVVRDVTRLRRLEEMRSEFVANVSHELRTPLSVFHGYLENLLETEEMDPEEAKYSLGVMRKHSLRMNALVEDLLTLARLESGGSALETEPVEISDFLEDVRCDWDPRAVAKKLRLGLEITPNLPEVAADTLKLRQVLDNLLDNAMKHTPAGGSVMLRARPYSEGENSTKYVDLSVEDTGAGIPPDDLPHVFERFYRADKARSRELGGTGLGLAIVKHIAQAHGGSVHAESEYGKGTRITLRLPVTDLV